MNVQCQLNQLRGLIQLLRVEDENSDDDSDSDPILPSTTSVPSGPGCIKPKSSAESEPKQPKPSPYEKIDNGAEQLGWEDEGGVEEPFDLPQPEFKISYKQAVTTEDLYLGMSNKSPATASCEDIVLEIKLPDETVGIEMMTLNVTEKEVHFASPQYKTTIPLPYSVDPNQGKAVYNNDHKILKLTLRMKRELDFVNF